MNTIQVIQPQLYARFYVQINIVPQNFLIAFLESFTKIFGQFFLSGFIRRFFWSKMPKKMTFFKALKGVPGRRRGHSGAFLLLRGTFRHIGVKNGRSILPESSDL